MKREPIYSTAAQRRHRALLRRWAVGKATSAEIHECMALDRRVRQCAARGVDVSKMGRAAAGVTP